MVILVLFVLATGLFAAGVELTGVGVRATSLGGNYRAVSNDYSGMYWNPAGIVFSKGLKVGASVEFLQPVVDYTANQPFSATSGSEAESVHKTYLMPTFGVYYSNEKYAYGLGFWAPFGLGAKWDFMNTSTYNPTYPKYEYEDDLKVMVLQPTFAYKLADNLSAGIGVSLVYGNIQIRKVNFTQNPVVFNAAYAQLKAALAASAAAPYDQVLTDSDVEGTGYGFGAAFGLQWKPVESLTLGASMKWYNKINLSGTMVADTYYPVGPANVKPTLDYLKSVNAISAAQYQQLMGLYSGVKNPTIPKKDVTAEMNLPLSYGAGFAFTGIKNLLVCGDVTYTGWSVWDEIAIKNEDGSDASALNLQWKDSWRYGVGLEYSLGFVKVRGSYYSEQRAAVDETMTIGIPDVNKRNTVVLGAGIPVGPFEIGLMFEKIMIGDYDVKDWVTATDPTTGNVNYENFAGKYAMNVTNFMVGIDYNF